jgi:hypothetical protein
VADVRYPPLKRNQACLGTGDDGVDKTYDFIETYKQPRRPHEKEMPVRSRLGPERECLKQGKRKSKSDQTTEV